MPRYDVSFLNQQLHHLDLPPVLFEVHVVCERYDAEDGFYEVGITRLVGTITEAMILADEPNLLEIRAVRKQTIKIINEYREMVGYGYPKREAFDALYFASLGGMK